VLHNLFQFGFAGLAGISLLGAFLRRAHRGSFFAAAILAGSAAIAAHYNVFWALAVFGMAVPWALFCATSYVDFAWRLKTGFVLFLAMGASLAIYPTVHDERYGKVDLSLLSPEEREKTESAARSGDAGFGAFVRHHIPFRLVRGLDLKGGLRLVYTVDVDEAIKDRRDRYYDDLRGALAQTFGFATNDKPTVEQLSKLPEKVKVEKSREHADTITLTFVDPADSRKVNQAFLAKYQLQSLPSPDGKKLTLRLHSDVESEIRSKAVMQAKETVNRRIDSMGVKEPNVTVRDEDIIVEMPGDDKKAFDEVKEIIAQTARLEFKMVDDDVDFFEAQSKGDLGVKGLAIAIENAPVGKSATGEKKSKANHFAKLTKSDHEEMSEALKRLKEWVATLQVDPDHEIGFGKIQDYNEEREQVEDVGWRTYYLFSKAEVTGDMVRDASAQADQSDRGMGGWHVRMELNPRGGDIFEDITGKNVNRRFAIILDGKVESAPVIITKIPGGIATITMGSGNQEQQLADSRKLELVLKSGALPAPITFSSQQLIGPTLGNDAIVQGGKGALAGAILVVVFMLVYYSRAGMIANIAVLFNLVLQVACLAMIGASMTLPGIAGLTLTIGIAVDANVLINERIREELRLGKSTRAAVDIGYDKAFTAILDGHVTTLLSGLILMQYGTGPIKGFAVTLFIGVLASLFTGVVCTRLMFDWAVRHRKVKNLHLG
jgi:preprotein translocase subunit SecD